MACATGEFYTDFNSTKTLYSIPDLEHRGDIHGQSEVRSQDSELPNTLNQRPFLDGSWSGCQLPQSVKLWMIVGITSSMLVQYIEANYKNTYDEIYTAW